jgi:hypothetical protein
LPYAERELARVKQAAHIGWVEEWLSVYHFNTANPTTFMESLQANVHPEIWNAIWAVYGTRSHSRRRFSAKVRKTRAWDRLANVVLGPGHTRIAVLGNGVFNASAKGRHSVPTKAVWRNLAARGLVVLVDEYLTTMTCNFCHGRNVRNPNAWSVVHCTYKRCHVTWNRDANASANIALLWEEHHQGNPRPHALRRPANH